MISFVTSCLWSSGGDLFSEICFRSYRFFFQNGVSCAGVSEQTFPSRWTGLPLQGAVERNIRRSHRLIGPRE